MNQCMTRKERRKKLLTKKVKYGQDFSKKGDIMNVSVQSMHTCKKWPFPLRNNFVQMVIA
jgi:hypothetical protein